MCVQWKLSTLIIPCPKLWLGGRSTGSHLTNSQIQIWQNQCCLKNLQAEESVWKFKFANWLTCRLVLLCSKFAPDLAWTGFPITQTEAGALGKAEPKILPAYSRAWWEPANRQPKKRITHLLQDRDSTFSWSDWDFCSDFLGLEYFPLKLLKDFHLYSSGLLNKNWIFSV